jgi:hypothetical protein
MESSNRWIEAGPVICLFRRVTGLPCPTCGLTRGTAYLVRGEVHAAVSAHPLSPFVIVAALIAVLLRLPRLGPALRRLAVRGRERVMAVPARWRWGATALLGAGWVWWVVGRWRPTP